VLVLDHVAVHTAGVTRTVRDAAAEDRPAARPEPGTVDRYADFLHRTAEAIRCYGRTRFEAAPEAELKDAVAGLEDTLDALRAHLPGAVGDDPEALATHGALLAQARRLAEQFVRSV
jgi:hypothetical protein